MPEKRNPNRSIPASPTIVKEYILGILGSGQPMKRDELISRACALARTNGFVLEAANVTKTVKKALSLLARERRVETPRTGWWRIMKSGSSLGAAVVTGKEQKIEPTQGKLEVVPAVAIQELIPVSE